jgi:hypothetical protein
MAARKRFKPKGAVGARKWIVIGVAAGAVLLTAIGAFFGIRMLMKADGGSSSRVHVESHSDAGGKGISLQVKIPGKLFATTFDRLELEEYRDLSPGVIRRDFLLVAPDGSRIPCDSAKAMFDPLLDEIRKELGDSRVITTQASGMTTLREEGAAIKTRLIISYGPQTLHMYRCPKEVQVDMSFPLTPEQLAMYRENKLMLQFRDQAPAKIK